MSCFRIRRRIRFCPAIAKPADSAYNSLHSHRTYSFPYSEFIPRGRAIRIDGNTKLLGVFGYPVEHSLSPAMHNAAISALGLHFAYIPFSVMPEDLGPAIQSLSKLGILGVNLTIPHKERVVPFLDELSEEARAVGAVNTVHVTDGRLIGYNTDGDGFMAPLSEIGFSALGAKALVLGAGGAARSVVYRLASEGASVKVANRTLERAQALAIQFRRLIPESEIRAIPMDSVGAETESADLVVNTTSLGMHPDEDGVPPFPLDRLHEDQFVYDLVYRPLETKFLRAARENGAQTINGIKMLVHQGAESFRIWTGMNPPIDVMEQAVLEGFAVLK